MSAVWVSHHEELRSDGVVAPPVFDPLVGHALGVVLDRRNPSGAAVDAGLDAASGPLWVEHAPAGGILRAQH